MSDTAAVFLRQAEISESTRPLRIALFADTFLPRFDGSIRRVCHTISHLREFGHEVLVIAPDGGITDFEGARIHGVPGFPFPLYREVRLAIPRPSIGRVLTPFRPDLIHAINPASLGASAFYYATVQRVPLVVSYHTQIPKYLHYYGLGFLEGLAWWGIRASYNRADLALVTSRAMKTVLEEHGVRRVELWQRGVDTQLFRPDRASPEMRARLTQGHPEDKLLLCVGRLAAEKEIERCREVLAAIPALRLAIVGDGPHRDKLERYFAGTRTYFAGHLKGVELAAAFSSADVFFLPSRTETLGLVLLEAMAAGCPLVAARAGGVPDIVEDGVTGYLFEPGKPGIAIECVRQLLDDSASREQMVHHARLEAERWSWRAATRQLESFYRAAISRDEKLPQQIAAQRTRGVSVDDTCKALQISRATLRRHARTRAWFFFAPSWAGASLRDREGRK